MTINELPEFLFDPNFLTAEEAAEYLREVAKAPFYFDIDGAGAARDGITGLIGSYYADKPLMVAGHNDEDYVDILRPMARTIFERFAAKHGLELDEVTRTRHNICFRSFDRRPMTPHVDVGRLHKHWAFVLYLNDADGDTILFHQKFDGVTVRGQDDLTIYKKFTPVAGGALLFDGDYFHAWEHPIAAEYRVVLNMNVQLSGVPDPATSNE
jgi:hypothetical protein